MAVDKHFRAGLFGALLELFSLSAAEFQAVGLGDRLFIGAGFGLTCFGKGEDLGHGFRICRLRGGSKSIPAEAEMKSRKGFKSGRRRKACTQKQSLARPIAMGDASIKITRPEAGAGKVNQRGQGGRGIPSPRRLFAQPVTDAIARWLDADEIDPTDQCSVENNGKAQRVVGSGELSRQGSDRHGREHGVVTVARQMVDVSGDQIVQRWRIAGL